jgi:tetratricopeptide (TPR) repeat protein
VKREQGLLVATFAILGLMTWSLYSDGGGLRGPRSAKALVLEIDQFGADDPVVNLIGPLDARDALIKPQADAPLEPLVLPAPPLADLPALLPPPVPDSGLDHWSEHLFRYPTVPQGALDDLVSAAQVDQFIGTDDQAGTDSSIVSDPGSDANDDPYTDQDPATQYSALYDSVRLDAIRTFYGWVLDEDRFDKKNGEPIRFQQVNPKTGQELFAPRDFKTGEYENFTLALTLHNRIEMRVREMRKATHGRTEELRQHIHWLLDNAIAEPIAFGYAEEHARQLIGLDKDDATNWLTLGLVWERTFRFDEAFSLYGRLAGENLPASAPDLGLEVENGRFQTLAAMRLGMARIMLRIGMGIEAEKLLRRANQLEPNNPAALYALGQVLLDSNRASEALPYLRRVASLPMARTDFVALANGLALAKAYLASGLWSEAKAAYADTARAAGGKAEALDARQGEIAAAYLAGEFAEALQGAQDAIEEFGPKSGLLYLRGLATAADGGSAAEVVRDLRAAAEADPLDAAPALAALAFWYDVLEMPTEASEALEKALLLEPDLDYGRYLMARWAARDGQPETASEELRKLVAKGPRCGAALAELAWLLHQLEVYPAAEVAFRRAELVRPAWATSKGNAPQWADLAMRRGLNQMDMEEWEVAGEHLREAISLNAGQFSAQNSLAAVAYSQGDLVQAVSDFGFLQDNLRQIPEDPQYLYAQSWQERIRAHSLLRRWSDSFDGSRLRPGWETQDVARNGVGPVLEDGKLVIRGNHGEQGKTRASRKVIALNFQSFKGQLEVGPDHRGDAGLFLAVETRQGRATWIFKVFRDRNSQLVYQWVQGAKEERQLLGRKLAANEPIQIEFRLDREPSTPILQVRLDDQVIYEGPSAFLKSASGELVFGVYAETANALPVDVSLDDVEVIYAKP